jgi:signal peptidase II
VRRARLFGVIALVTALALDQASKFVVTREFDGTGRAPVFLTPFLDLQLNWNRGISFSLFPQDTYAGIWLLLAVTLGATAMLAIWLWFARAPIVGVGLGAIIGGALGNGWDRWAHGAVVDFLDLHALGRHFFVFNIADAAINLGVVLLIADALFGHGGERAAEAGKVSPPS